MAIYCRGTSAYGFCKQCGFRYYLHELKLDGRFPEQKLLVCSTCWDPWDPQEHPFPPAIDPQALKWPSPEVGNPAETVAGSAMSIGMGNATTTYFMAYQGGNASTPWYVYGYNQFYGGNALTEQQALNI